MIIKLSPILMYTDFNVSVAGDVLTINGDELDFSPLPNGASLPKAAIANDWILGDVVRDAEGVLHVSLMFPHGPDASEAARFPEPITITEDGPVELPV
ncbi:hypothetical protein D3C78_1101550 [compost metagenome]